MGLCASHAHRPAQDRGTHPLLACAPVSMVAGPRQTALRTFTGAVTAIAKTYKANDVSGHDLANLTQEFLVSQLGFSFFAAKKILAVRATLEQWRVTCGEGTASVLTRGACGRQRLQRCPHLRRFQNSVLCRVVPESVAFQRVRASMCKSVWLRWGAGRALSRCLGGAKRNENDTRSRAPTRTPHIARRHQARGPPTLALTNSQQHVGVHKPRLCGCWGRCVAGKTCAWTCAHGRVVCVSMEVGFTAGGPPGGLTRKSMPRHAPPTHTCKCELRKVWF